MIDGIKKSVDERAITLYLSVEVWQAHPRKLGYCQALGARRHCRVPVEPHQHAPSTAVEAPSRTHARRREEGSMMTPPPFRLRRPP